MNENIGHVMAAMALSRVCDYDLEDGIYRLEGYLKGRKMIIPIANIYDAAAWFLSHYHKVQIGEYRELPPFDDLALHRYSEYLGKKLTASIGY